MSRTIINDKMISNLSTADGLISTSLHWIEEEDRYKTVIKSMGVVIMDGPVHVSREEYYEIRVSIRLPNVPVHNTSIRCNAKSCDELDALNEYYLTLRQQELWLDKYNNTELGKSTHGNKIEWVTSSPNCQDCASV